MMQLMIVFLLIFLFHNSAAAQSLKEIRIGSSNISVINVVVYYARDRKFFESEGFKIVIDSAVERGLTDKPLTPDAVTNFSITKNIRF